MRRMMLAATLVALPVAAWADVPAITVGQPVNYNVTAPNTTTWKVALSAGGYYALGTVIGTPGWVSVQLNDAAGNTLASSYGYGDTPVSRGGSFKAPYSGDYFVTATAETRYGDASDPAFGQIFVNVDCSNNLKTNCSVPVGKVRANRQFDYQGDSDWFRTLLQARKHYTATLSGPAQQPADCTAIQAFDAKGKSIQPGGVTILPDGSVTMNFTAPANGTAFIGVSFSCDYGAPRYNIGLALRK